jgi:hypothetical protein
MPADAKVLMRAAASSCVNSDLYDTTASIEFAGFEDADADC